MKKKILIIVPIILVLIAGIFTSLYFFTDLFKSPKTLFYKYVAKSAEPLKELSYDEFLGDLEKVTKTPVTSEGSVSIEADLNDTSADILKDLKIDYTAKAAPAEDKFEYNFNLKYKDEKALSASILGNNNKYGIKSEDLYKDYIYVENANLKDLAKKLGMDNSSIPDSFQDINIYDLYYISKDTRKSIKDTYYKALDKELDKDNFSAEKNVKVDVNGKEVKADAYTLTLKPEDVYDIMIALFETLESDDETLDLLMQKYEMLASYASADEKLSKEDLKSAVSDIVKDLKSSKTKAEGASGKLRLTVYASKGQTVKIQAKLGDEAAYLDITKNKKDGIISFGVEENGETAILLENKYEVKDKTTTGTIKLTSQDEEIATGNYSIEKKDDSRKVSFKLTSPEFDNGSIELNLETTGKIGEGTNTCKLSLAINYNEQFIKLNLEQTSKYNPENISFDDFTSTNSICLNTASDAEIEQLKTDINTNSQALSTKLNGIFDFNTNNLNVDLPVTSLNVDLPTNGTVKLPSEVSL